MKRLTREMRLQTMPLPVVNTDAECYSNWLLTAAHTANARCLDRMLDNVRQAVALARRGEKVEYVP